LFCRFFTALFRAGFPTTDHYLRDLAGQRFDDVKGDPAARQFAESVYGALADFYHERAGYYNDVSTWVREDVLTTGQVTCPTLVVHDTADPAAPFCHAEYAASRIPDAEVTALDAGGHLIWFGRDSDRMRRRRCEFLGEHLNAVSA
jgi:pimeloyl-ACP methyl ester carboxylesterase